MAPNQRLLFVASICVVTSFLLSKNSWMRPESESGNRGCVRLWLWLGGVGVGSVLLFLVCVLGVLVVVVVPASEFAVFDGVFSSVYSVVFVVDLSEARPLRSFAKATSPGWCFASFVDAVFVSGDDAFAHGDGESGALGADIEWL